MCLPASGNVSPLRSCQSYFTHIMILVTVVVQFCTGQSGNCAGAERVGHTGLLQAASEHPVARLLLDNYYDQIAGGGGSPQ